ncbi:MAG: UDP-4-amino-4,6-dideoxy-N-acetyl-beta-L-altrosamine transaminase [Candidatus Methylacidiphilales bacterium]
MFSLSDRILVTGLTGRLGYAIRQRWAQSCQLTGTYRQSRPEDPSCEWVCCDLTKPDTAACLAGLKPDILIHAASWTDLDQCEREPEEARRQIVDATREVAEATARSGAKLVLISTDCVYGDRSGPHREEDPCEPCNAYGQLKLEAENVAAEICPDALILRVNFFGWSPPGRRGLVEWILDEAHHGREIPVWEDVHFSPLYVPDVCRVIERAVNQKLTGVYNVAAADGISKADFAELVIQRFHLKGVRLKRGSFKAAKLHAQRAQDLRMDGTKLSDVLGYPLRSVEESLAEMRRDQPSEMSANETSGLVSFGEKISYGRQTITTRDYHAVRRAVLKPYLTQGKAVTDFEAKLAEWTGARHVIAVNSGTAAAHLACMAAGLSAGDEMITSPITFVASSNAALYCGARPVFADVDPETRNLDPSETRRKGSAATRAIMPVHYAGQSCDMKAFRALADEWQQQNGKKVWLIEDASHALGSTYQGEPVCGCAWSDMAITSFHPVKHITTGEGGAVFTNDDELAATLRMLRTHGITGEEARFESGGDRGPWVYQQQLLGYNYRITDYQCALGISQMEQFPEFIRRRREQMERYQTLLGGWPGLTLPVEREPGSSNLHLYAVEIKFSMLGRNRQQVMLELRERGFITQVHYIPVHTQPYYRRHLGTGSGDCPKAEAFYAGALSLPIHPTLTEQDQRRFVEEFRAVLYP